MLLRHITRILYSLIKIHYVRSNKMVFKMRIVGNWKYSAFTKIKLSLQPPILFLFSHLHLFFCFNLFFFLETVEFSFFHCVVHCRSNKPRNSPASASLVLEPSGLAFSYLNLLMLKIRYRFGDP